MDVVIQFFHFRNEGICNHISRHEAKAASLAGKKEGRESDCKEKAASSSSLLNGVFGLIGIWFVQVDKGGSAVTGDSVRSAGDVTANSCYFANMVVR